MKTSFLNRMLGVLATAIGVVAPLEASAQLFRTYLSIIGSDTNPCTVTAPCRLLPAALAAAADGGEVWMLDSANYNTGPVTVTKSITVLAVPGVVGSLVGTAGGPALTINTAGVKVALRNLNVAPLAGANANGVEFYSGTSLVVENCAFSQLGFGIYVSGVLQVTIADSRFSGNNYGVALNMGASGRISGSSFAHHGGGAVYAAGLTGPVVSVAITRSVSSNDRVGFSATAQNVGTSVRMSVSDSLVESNSIYGVDVFSVSGSTSEASVSRTLFTRNGAGVRAAGVGGKAVVSGSSFVLNDTGIWQLNSAVVESVGDNTVRANTNNTTGSVTLVSKM